MSTALHALAAAAAARRAAKAAETMKRRAVYAAIAAAVAFVSALLFAGGLAVWLEAALPPGWFTGAGFLIAGAGVLLLALLVFAVGQLRGGSKRDPGDELARAAEEAGETLGGLARDLGSEARQAAKDPRARTLGLLAAGLAGLYAARKL